MRTIYQRTPGTTTTIIMERHGLARLGARLSKSLRSRRCAFVYDEKLPPILWRRAVTSLRMHGFKVTVHSLVATERRKNVATVLQLYDIFWRDHLERDSFVIALGGGVTGDIVGHAASTYLRGLPYVLCPTTLLAMTDAAIGGKVGVNLKQGKNLVGGFCAPRLVLLDPSLLSTLPQQEIANGLAECVKHAIIDGPRSFRWLEDHVVKIAARRQTILDELVYRQAALKAAVVNRDPFERGERAFLNLGHTFAHAIEVTRGYGIIPHGQAVSLGLVAASDVAVATRRCSAETARRISQLLKKCRLPLVAPLPPVGKLMSAMRGDKKNKSGRIRLVLPLKFGQMEIIDDIPSAVIHEAWLRVGAQRI